MYNKQRLPITYNKQRLPLQVPVPLNNLSRYVYFEHLLQQPGEHINIISLPYGPNNINSLQTFVPVTPTEFEVLLSQSNPRKSPGLDMISLFELKMVQQQISTQLAIYIFSSMSHWQLGSCQLNSRQGK